MSKTLKKIMILQQYLIGTAEPTMPPFHCSLRFQTEVGFFLSKKRPAFFTLLFQNEEGPIFFVFYLIMPYMGSITIHGWAFKIIE